MYQDFKRKRIDTALGPRDPLGVNLAQLSSSHITREKLDRSYKNRLIAPIVTTGDNSGVNVKNFVSPWTAKKSPDLKGSKSFIELIMTS